MQKLVWTEETSPWRKKERGEEVQDETSTTVVKVLVTMSQSSFSLHKNPERNENFDTFLWMFQQEHRHYDDENLEEIKFYYHTIWTLLYGPCLV
jgi:hypothetical protein